jgi:hypothetical protein
MTQHRTPSIRTEWNRLTVDQRIQEILTNSNLYQRWRRIKKLAEFYSRQDHNEHTSK